MRSLRLRFFLISWPLVVAAIAFVAFGIDRFAVVELERVETRAPDRVGDATVEAWAETIAASWGSIDRALLARLAASATPPADLVVVDAEGRLVASSNDAVRLADGGPAPSGAVRLVRREPGPPGRLAEAEFTMSGVRIGSFGRLVVLPHPPPPIKSVALRSRLRRTIWIAAAAASLASAAAAILLAGPLVRQVRRLSGAAASIREGAFSTRVRSEGGDEIAELERSFNAMAASLERAEAHKRNLVADVAHELRTPLTNVIALIESIQDGLRQPDAAMLASLRDEAQLLAELVGELQELSLAESGQLPFELTTFDAVAAARAAVEAIRPASDGVSLEGPDGALPALVRADPRRLAQILRNLLRNAITHTPAGGRVRVEVRATPEQVVITVADTGRGIPAEHLPLVWERFHRVDPSRDRAGGGSGLGLAIVKTLVEGMGGRVGVTSAEGRGSTFEVRLKRPTISGA